jgi:hypothetical protein
MFRLFLGWCVVAVAFVLPGSAAASTYQWKKRPLYVFAPAASDAGLSSQRAIVAANRAGFAERDMVVVYVVGGSVTADLGAAPGVGADALRRRYGAGAGFRVVLVGKDGGAKLSQSSPLSAATLFRTIDAMPMRAQEMRRR